MKGFLSIKGLVIVAAAAFAPVARAESQSASANGFIHYEALGDVVKRDVVMTMERLGEDEAKFILSSGDWSLESRQGFMKEMRGAQIAFVAFENAWQVQQGEVSHLLFKGVKLQGENRMVYQGTLYKTTAAQLSLSGETFAECIQQIKDSGTIDDDWKISGTFYFKKDLDQTAD